ncbi:MAG: hypothetical protein U1B80_10665 [Anaerolineaceae bacterium]|nr:hypothetical protein [Anaerolineaceae bacterium]
MNCKFLSMFRMAIGLIALLAVNSTASAALPVALTGALPESAAVEKLVPSLPSMRDFAFSVINGSQDNLVGVYVEQVMALPVIQQPGGDATFVSTQSDVVTEFRFARKRQSIGLLAHNYLAGDHFAQITPGETITLVYGDGSLASYRVFELQRYQALNPIDPYSNFVDLANPSTTLTSTEVFYRTYGVGNLLVLQTCIQQGSQDSWGRLFILAEPVNEEQSLSLVQFIQWDLHALLTTEYTVAV